MGRQYWVTMSNTRPMDLCAVLTYGPSPPPPLPPLAPLPGSAPAERTTVTACRLVPYSTRSTVFTAIVLWEKNLDKSRIAVEGTGPRSSHRTSIKQ